MKKYIVYLMMAIMSLIGCHKNEIPKANLLFAGEFGVLTHFDWKQQFKYDIPKSDPLEEHDAIAGYINPKDQTLLMLTKRVCKFGRNSCIVETMRGLQTDGFELIDAYDVVIEDRPFVVVLSKNDSSIVYTWICYDPYYVVYTFSCGGFLGREEYVKGMCSDISKTLIVFDKPR